MGRRHQGTKQQALLGSAGRSVHVGFKLRGSGLQVQLEKQVNIGVTSSLGCVGLRVLALPSRVKAQG